MRERTVFILLVVAVLCVCIPSAWAKDPTSVSGTQASTQFPQQRAGEPPIDPDMEKQMAKARLEQRYKDLKRDSQKLLELATELKQYVDRSNENVLSMDVVKKCDEIEKLAKSVRSRMKGN